MIQALSIRVRRLGWLTRRFYRQQSGATAVEFGLIGLPFFALMMAIVETALVFWAGQQLETGVSNAGRLIRTGQVQAQNIDAAAFHQIMCGEIGVMFDCDGRLGIDVERVEQFDADDILSRTPVDSDGNFTGGFTFDPGIGGQTVIVRAYYRWPMLFNFFDLGTSGIGGRHQLLVATTAFRNEPFGS